MLKDRGTIKWTSLMLPEHVKLLKEMWIENEKVARPLIDVQMMEIFERTLIEAYEQQHSITLVYYNDGYIKEVSGNIDSFNQNKNTLTLKNGVKVLFYNIISIS